MTDVHVDSLALKLAANVLGDDQQQLSRYEWAFLLDLVNRFGTKEYTPDERREFRDRLIAQYVVSREAKGVKTEAAVAEIKGIFGLSRPSIFNILRDERPKLGWLATALSCVAQLELVELIEESNKIATE